MREWRNEETRRGFCDKRHLCSGTLKLWTAILGLVIGQSPTEMGGTQASEGDTLPVQDSYQFMGITEGRGGTLPRLKPFGCLASSGWVGPQGLVQAQIPWSVLSSYFGFWTRMYMHFAVDYLVVFWKVLLWMFVSCWFPCSVWVSLESNLCQHRSVTAAIVVSFFLAWGKHKAVADCPALTSRSHRNCSWIAPQSFRW